MLLKLLSSEWINNKVAVIGENYTEHGKHLDSKYLEISKHSTKMQLHIAEENYLTNLLIDVVERKGKTNKKIMQIHYEFTTYYLHKFRYLCNNKRKVYIDLLEYYKRACVKQINTTYIPLIESPTILLITIGYDFRKTEYPKHVINNNQLLGVWAYEPLSVNKYKPSSYKDITEHVVFKGK